ncbi:MAG: DUF4391 domain-containing protein [Bacteroidota bacterium]
MDFFNLPPTTKVNRVIPKNAFDNYTNTRQKKLFSDLVARITWTHKLSSKTVNLQAKEIQEIQIFQVELKTMTDIQAVLAIIDKAIPYTIIFIVEFDDSMFISTSTKHAHPVNEDNSVIDWTFKTDWFLKSENKYSLTLKKSLDSVHQDLCVQISGKPTMANKPIEELIEFKREILILEKEIARLKSGIKNGKQFNYKVDLNIKLKEAEKQLLTLISNN